MELLLDILASLGSVLRNSGIGSREWSCAILCKIKYDNDSNSVRDTLNRAFLEFQK